MVRLVSKTAVGITLAAMIAAGGAATLARAQTADPPPGPPAQPSTDPRDFSGVWQESINGRHAALYQYPLVGGGDPPFLPWAAAEAKRREDARKAGKPINDYTSQCLPSGIPRVLGAGYPLKIMQTNKEMVTLFEVGHMFRFVYLNENHPPADDLDPTFMGHSVGHWEGNALVVDTVALRKETLLSRGGYPHSEKLHIIEHWSKSADGKTLTDRITIDDPGAYTKPWSWEHHYTWSPLVRFEEYICEDNNRNTTDANGVVGVK